jgi:hypothetical protein
MIMGWYADTPGAPREHAHDHREVEAQPKRPVM